MVNADDSEQLHLRWRDDRNKWKLYDEKVLTERVWRIMGKFASYVVWYESGLLERTERSRVTTTMGYVSIEAEGRLTNIATPSNEQTRL